MMYYKKTLIVLTIILGLLISLQSMAEEPNLNCETFVNEKICRMTPAEQEKWFWDLFNELINSTDEVEIVEV